MSWLSLANIVGQLWMRMADASLRAIILATLAGLLVACLRKRAAAQHVVWTVVVSGMVLLPVLRPMIPAARLPIAEPPMLQAVSVGPQPQLAATSGSVLSAPANASTEAASLRPSWHVYAVIIYTAGVLFVGLRLFLGLFLSRSLLRRARPLRQELGRYHNLIADARVEVEIQESERVRVPVTLGFKTMRVILPEEWRAWPEEKIIVVLVHELAHARRRDPLVALMAAVNKCIFWFHPLAWWLERQLAVLAEQSADDVAVAVAHDANSYARMVLEVASGMKEQNRRLVWHGAALDGPLLAKRIRRVIDPRTQKYTKRLGNTAQVGLLTSAGLLLWIATAVDFHNTAQAQTAASGPLVSPQSVGVSEQVAAGNLIKAPLPVYPPLAKTERIQGMVILQAGVDIHGDVTELKVISGHPMLVRAAVEAVRSYVYKPFFLNGKAVPFQTTVQVPFVLEATVGPEIETQLNAASQPASANPPPPLPRPPQTAVPSVAGSLRGIRVSQETAAGNLIEPVKPVYPPLAKAARVQGVVRLNVQIGSDGRVTSVNVISGHPVLAQAAIEVVKQYVYKPYLINGNPVEIVTVVEIPFEDDLSGQSVRQDQFMPVGGGWWVEQPTSVEQALDSTLAALRERGASQNRLSQQLAHLMMRLADNDRRPPWPVLVSLTDKLTNELIGRQLDIAQITTLRECVIGVMRRTGSNARLASRFQETLAGIGIESSKIQLVVKDFIAVGEAIGGPDDLPVRR